VLPGVRWPVCWAVWRAKWSSGRPGGAVMCAAFLVPTDGPGAAKFRNAADCAGRSGDRSSGGCSSVHPRSSLTWDLYTTAVRLVLCWRRWFAPKPPGVDSLWWDDPVSRRTVKSRPAGACPRPVSGTPGPRSPLPVVPGQRGTGKRACPRARRTGRLFLPRKFLGRTRRRPDPVACGRRLGARLPELSASRAQGWATPEVAGPWRWRLIEG